MIITQCKHTLKHHTVSHKYTCMLLNIIKNKHFLNSNISYMAIIEIQDFSTKCSCSTLLSFDPVSKCTENCRTVKKLGHPRNYWEEPNGHILDSMNYLVFELKYNIVISVCLCHFVTTTGLISPSVYQKDIITQLANQRFSSHLPCIYQDVWTL